MRKIITLKSSIEKLQLNNTFYMHTNITSKKNPMTNFTKWCRTLCLFIIGTCSTFYSFGQVNTTVTMSAVAIGGSPFSSLAAAITAVNGLTITGPVVVTAAAGSEAAPNGTGYFITATGTVSNTIIIQGTATTTITAGINAANGSNDAIFKIVGGDFITIQNFTMQEDNVNNTVTATGATNTMTEAGVLIIHASATDGAQNNTIQNNIITLNAAYPNSVGILSTSSTTTTNASPGSNTTGDATSTAGTNSTNKIYGNTISNVAYGIYLICPPITATVFETGNDIGGTSLATGNTITFGNATATSGPWNRSFSTAQAGIAFRNGAGNSVRFNSVTSSSLAYVGSAGLNGVLISSGTAPSGVTYTSTISDNTVNITSTGIALMTGIDFGHGISTGTIIGSNNNVTMNQTATAANSAAIIGIKANYASASNTCNSNTILFNQSETTGALSSATTVLTLAGTSASTINANSNNITINQTGSGTGTITGAVIAISVAGTSTTNSVLTNTILVNQTTSVASGITNAITGIVATSAASVALNITTTNAITIKQAITGSGTYGSGAIIYLSISAAHNNVNITGNTFNTTGSTIRSTGSLDVILDGSSTKTGLLNIKSNTTNIDRNAASGAVGFYTQTSTSPNDPADTISSNAITFTGLTGTSSVSVIQRLGGSTTATKNYCNNTISITGTHSGTTAAMTVAYSSTDLVRGNSITMTSAAPTMTGITGNSNGVANTISGNTVSLTSSATSPTSMVGISNASTGANTISNNIISSLNFNGILTSAPSVSGISISSGSTNTISNNSISGVSVGAATSAVSPTIDGMLISGGTTNTISKNVICSITTACNGASTIISGMRISAGTTNNVSNNRIGNLTASATTNTDGVRGINLTSTTTLSALNIYYNTIYLSSTTAAATFGSTGLFHAASTTATTATLDLRNNIIINNSSFAGAGLTVAYRRSAGGANNLNNFASTSNRNLFYAGTPGTNNLIYSDGTGSAQTLAAYKAGVFTAGTIAPRDANSISENPFFLSTTCGSVDFLKIHPFVPTGIESGAANIAGITDDFENDVRAGNPGYPSQSNGAGSAPDIGADEFDGTALANCSGTPASSTITGASSVCFNTGTTLSLSFGYTDLGITYQWVSGTTLGGPYPNNLGTSSTQATGNLTTPTYYKCMITCSNSGQTFTTPEKAVTVNALPTVGISPISGSICNPGGAAVTLTASGGTSYSWSPVTGLTPTTGSPVSANPSSTTTYTVTGTAANGCTNTATALITIGNAPAAVTITPSAPSICSGGSTPLTASGGTVGAAGPITLGTASTLTGAQTQPTAFCNRWAQYWNQTIYTVAELSAAGLTAGSKISSVTYTTTTQGDAANNTNFSISIGNTASTTLSAFQTTGLSVVFGPTSYTHAVGTNLIPFSSTFTWDGSSNIILDVRQDGVDNLNNAITFFTAATDNKNIEAHTSTISGTTTLQSLVASATVTPTASTTRLNIVFGLTQTNPTWTWSPSTALSATTGASVTASPGSTTTYTATATISGCSSAGTRLVTVDQPPTANAGPNITGCVCCGTIFTVTGIIGGTATGANWTHNGGGTISNGGVWTGTGETYTPGAPDLNPPFPKTITVTLTTNASGTCPAAVSTLTITINQVPNLSTTSALFCPPGPVNLSTLVTDLNNTTGTLAYYATLANAQSETSPISNNVSSAGTYYVRKNTSSTPSCTDIKSITVNADTQAPTISCPPTASLACNAAVPSGATTVAGFQAQGGTISDNCTGAITVSSSDAVSSTGCVETTTRTYTVSDASSNSATCTQTITRTVDTQAPTITCPLTAALACNATVPSGATTVAGFQSQGGTITDNCTGAITVSSSDAVSSTGCVETTTRTYTVADACGNSATCTQTITRTVDTQAPTITCPPTASLPCNATITAAAITSIGFIAQGGTITDNCTGAITVSSSDAVSSSGCVETTTRTYTVSDACGNSSTCTQTITRTVDTQAPVITCPPTASLACNATVPSGATTAAGFTAQGGTITDNCTGAITVSSSDAISSTGCVETTTRTYTVTDACGNSATCTQTITRTVDTQVPTISCPPTASLACNVTVPSAATDVAGFTAQGGTISDNCTGTITVSSSDAVSSTGCVETTTRTYTVTDACGNSATCTQTITRTVDTQAPVITCPTATLVCNAPVPAAATTVAGFTAQGGTITDNCTGAITVSSSDAVTTSGCSETTARTYTVTDACGNSATCTQTITRTVDTQAPTISCPPTASLACNATVPSAATDVAGFQSQGGTITDNCTGAITVSSSDAVSSTGCVETTIRTYTVADACGNSATCTQTITRTVDTQAPTITCPPTASLACNATVPSVATDVAGFTAQGGTITDNCTGTITVSSSDAVSNSGCVETTTRTYTVTDACGNSATCTQTITRTVDTQAPTITCPPTASLACNATVPSGATTVAGFTAQGGTITDNCTGAITVSASDAVSNTGCVETTTRTYTVTDACGNSATCTQTITRTIDTQAPTITCPPTASLACNATVPSGATTVAGFQAQGGSITDNCTGAITVSSSDAISSTGCVETTTRTYTVADACGNSATCTQTITRTVDTQAPVITCPTTTLVCNAPVPVAATDVASFTAQGGTITDNCTGAITVGSSDAVTTSGCSETTSRTYTVTDACGNSATCTQTITRTVDTQAPTITCPPTASLACNATVPSAATTEAGFTAQGGTITDNCTGAITVSSSDAVSNSGCVETTTRTYTVTDACGNSATCTQTITRTIDTQAPTITCPPTASLACNATVPAGATDVAGFTAQGGTITDNCTGTITVSSSDGVSSTGCVETTTRTYTVTDACGNSATCTQTITRTVDTQAPVITCPTATLVCNAPVPAAATDVASFTAQGGTITDNCTGAITVSSSDAVTTSGCSETTTRTYTVTDACSNSATCTQTITRTVDTQAPVITCPPTAALACNATMPSGATTVAGFTAQGGTITDNCTGAITVSSSDAVSSTGCVETTTRTYTVTDACGNSATCTQTITRAVDTQAPSITCPTATLVCNAPVPAAATDVASFTAQGGTITDNCTGAITVSSSDAVTTSGCSETTSRTYTVTDACGNSATCTQTITRTVDTQAPTITCPPTASLACNATVPSAATTEAGFTAQGGTITDNCTGAITVSSSDAVSSSGCVETTTRTYTVTDACGNSATCTQTITRTIDTQAPTITCPPTASLACNATVPAGATDVAGFTAQGGTITDNCTGTITVSSSDGVSSTGCVETTTRTYTVTDACGNSATCTQTITRTVDTQSPTISCPPTAALACNATVPSAATDVAGFMAQGGTINDNCTGAITVTHSDNVTTSGCVETTARTYTVTDACGNAAACTQTITRTVDTDPPVITCPPSDTLACNATVPAAASNQTGFLAQGGTISDNCTGTITVSSSDAVSSTGCVETTTRTYTVTDACGNSATCTQTITRTVDTQTPMVSCPPTAALSCNATVPAAATDVITFTAQGGSINDNCTGLITVTHIDAVTSSGCVETTTRTYTVTDACGNAAICTQMITRTVDTVAPAITCPPAPMLSCNATIPSAATDEAGFVAQGGTITDNCTGTINVSSSDAVTTSGCTETTTRTYTVTDACGNSATCTQTITRTVDTQAPNISCPNDTTINCQVAPVPANTGTATATDNCGILSITSSDVTTPGSCPNNYSISRTWTATDNCGLTSSCVQIITVQDTTKPTAICKNIIVALNPATGTATITAADINDGSFDNCGGVSLSASQTNFNCTDVGPNLITLTVTDQCFNQSTCTATVTVTSDLIVTITPQSPTVCTGSDLQINASVTGGNGMYSYSWTGSGASSLSSTSISNPVFNNSVNSTYSLTVTVTDGNGCTASNTISVTVNNSLNLSETHSPSVCASSANGFINVTVSGGTTPYTYLWSDAATINSPNRTGLSAGTYTVTVSDVNGCSSSLTVTIASTSCGIISDPCVCLDNASGAQPGDGQFSETVTVVGGNGPYTVQSSSGAYSFALSPPPPGAPVPLANGTPLTATINPDSSYIVFKTVDGQPWTMTVVDATNQTFTIGNVCSYPAPPVTTDVFVCQFSSPAPDLNVSVSGTNHTWYSSQTGGSGSSTAPTVDTSVPSVNTYYVSQDPDSSCEGPRSPITVTVYESPSLSLTQDSVSCAGDDGSITATGSNGTGPYDYSINPDPNSQSFTAESSPVTFTNLSAGNYTVTITDVNGCTSTAQISVLQAEPFEPTASVVDSITCFGASDGSVTVTVTGGSGTFTYEWSDGISTIGTTQTISGLPSGTYTVTVTDEHNCSSSTSVFLDDPIEIYANLDSSFDVQCHGHASGAIYITVAGGSSPYTFAWSNGATTEDVEDLVAGVYTVLITDLHGCTTEFVTAIDQNPIITVGQLQTNVSCNNGTDGTASVFVDGGVGPYTYLWNDGQTTFTAFDLTAGTYTVTITDASGTPGCDTIVTFLITQPSLLDATATTVDVLCYGQATGSITVNAFGGNPPYSYDWSNSATVTTNSQGGLFAGLYTIIVTDSTGCEKDVVIQVFQPDSFYVTKTITNASCFGADDGEATVIASGGTPAYTYLWSNGQTTVTATGLATGSYAVTVTDSRNCEVNVTVIIDQPSEIVIASSVSNVSCYGGNNGSIAITASGGSGGYTYLWNTSPGQTTNTATGLTAGVYEVNVTDASGCSSLASITVEEPDSIALNATVSPAICNGGSSGSISLFITGGTAPYSVIWSNGSLSQSGISGLLAGTYTVTVTDSAGCINTQSFEITEPTAIVIDPTVTNVSCNGSATGAITIAVSGGNSPYSLQWSNGETTATISGLYAGNYTVAVTDLGGCTVSLTIAVTEPAALTCVCNANVHNVSCYGGSNGSVQALPSGGTPPYSYSWIRTAPTPSGVLSTTQTLSGVTAGTYEVTITDASGCVKVGSATITQPAQILITPMITNIGCYGSSDGMVTAMVSGGVPPYTYSWNTSPAQTTSTATGLGAGSYTVIVTDANNCTSSLTITITQPALLKVTTTKTNASCNGGNSGAATASGSGGSAPYAYLWSNGKTTSNITGLVAGTYTVTVTDANGCTVTKSLNISQPPKISVLYVVTSPTCNGGTNGSIDITATGGTPPYTYLWSTGATTEDISGIGAGAFSVWVTDSKGCVKLANIFIQQPNAINVSITVNKNVNCNGGSNGKVTANVTGGTGPYTYLWSTGATTKTINGLAAGTYTVTVTDSKGCTGTSSATVTQPAVLICNTVVIQNVSCHGSKDGKIQVVASGGTPGYTYTWTTSPVATTAIVNNVGPGTYTVKVKDANGCTSTCQVTVTQPASITIVKAHTNITCNGGNNGTASVSPSGGTPPYSYLWNTGSAATTSSVSGLSVGTYTVTVTDANGCTKTASVSISQASGIVASIAHTNIGCNGAATGSITVTATGGGGSFIYTLNPGGTSNGTGIFTGLAAGSYTVVVTDGNGCTTSVAATITESSALSMDTVTGTNVNCHGGSDGTATAGTISGGTAPYSYSWSTTPMQGTVTATGLSAGTYTVTVTDSHGCTVMGSVTLTEPATSVAISAVGQNIPCNGGSSGSATASASGGTPPYTYIWSDGQTTQTATGLASGMYAVTATDASGCEASTTLNISQPGTLSVTATTTNASCNGGSNGTITAVATGGIPPYAYVLGTDTNGTGVFTNLIAGSYVVQAFDSGGCTASVSVQIYHPSAMIANVSSANVSCNGGANGTASVLVTGGTPAYSFSWNTAPVKTTQSISGLSAGTYIVIVTDANGCTISRTAVISEPPALVIAPSQTNADCNGAPVGTATATVSGGTPPYFYQWSNLQMTLTATGLASGTYTVTVTDYKSCTITASYVITQSGSIAGNASFSPVLCHGGTTTVTLSPTGGAGGPYSYSWSHDAGNSTNSAIVPAGVYYVTVTDLSGCSVVVTVNVTQPNALICATSSTPAPCFGGNGTATVSVVGGTAPYSYLWSNTSSNSSMSGVAGTYTVTVTDANGCTTTCSVVITEPDLFSISFSSSNTTCGNSNGSATVMVSGGTQPYSYLWSDGEITASVSGLDPGTYTVTVNDANGCGPLSATIIINANDPIECSITSTSPTCTGYQNGTATVSATGGVGSFTYLWNTAPTQTTQTATGLPAGTYEVIITDITGCSSVCSVEIEEPDPIAFTVEQSNVNCAGAASGSATITAFGGVPYSGGIYTYLWDNGQTTATATGLSSGTYIFTITDSVGCSATGYINMIQTVLLSCNTSSQPSLCGQTNGSAVVNVFGGTPPFAYLWNTIPAQTNAIANQLAGGTYTVVVTDANGCSTQCTATVQQAGSISYAMQVTNAPCAGGNGTISLIGLSGGSSPYTYLWSNGATTSGVSVPSGTYTLTVYDSGGCFRTDSAFVGEPVVLSVSTSAVNVTCNGYTNGSACASVTGGTQPYSFLWNTGTNISCINNRPAGTYTVTVTDSHGCISSATVVITQPSALDTISTSSTPSSCGSNNGTGTVNITGGTPPYSYSWQTVPVQATQTATGLPAGNNFVVVTDANGCNITVCVKVASGNGLAIWLDSPVYAGGVNIRCNGGADGSVNLTVSGTGPFTYNWSNGATIEDIFGLIAGTYTVTVSDGVCTVSASITLIEAPALNLTTSQTNSSCFGGNNGTATANPGGGTPPYSYSWSTSPVQTTQTATGLSAGTYTVTVSDANGCTRTSNVTITQPLSGLTITATQVNPTCNGYSNGSIDITVSGGVPPYQYLWTNGAVSEDQTGLPAGSYTVTVTDQNGCTIALCVVLVVPTPLQITVSSTNISCNGGNNGSACVGGTGGTPPYTYQWSIGNTTACISNLFTGTYTVTVTDAGGCSVMGTAIISQPGGMTLTLSKTDATSSGGTDGTTSVSVSGGASPYTYAWNTVPVKTTATITGLAAGTYQVTVTDAGGCVKSGSIAVGDPTYLCNPVTRPWRTESIVTWGVAANGVPTQSGQYLTNHFVAAFPSSLVVGGGCAGSKTLTLTNANAVRNFLNGQPNITSGVLAANLSNPTSSSYQNKLAAQVVALKISVTFDQMDPNFAAATTVSLGDAIITGMTGSLTIFNSMTVNAFLNEANKRLGNCTASPSATPAQWADAAEAINLAYVGGTAVNSGLLSCPAGNNRIIVLKDDWSVNAYPNPTTGIISIAFEVEHKEIITMTMTDVAGRQVWNSIENVFPGENITTNDFSTLPKGIYMMNIKTSDHVKVIRVVIQ